MADREEKNNRLHFALAGEKLTRDFTLIEVLGAQHHVSLINMSGQISDVSLLKSVNVIVLEYNAITPSGNDPLRSLRKLKNMFPHLCIVLINDGLSQPALAAAFHEGVRDYFRWPYDVKLLTERIQHLGRLHYEHTGSLETENKKP